MLKQGTVDDDSLVASQDADAGCVDTAEDERYEQLPLKQVKKNIACIIALDALWFIGMADFQMALQPFLVYLNASNTMIGFITGLMWPGILGIFVSPWLSNRIHSKKWYLFITATLYVSCLGVLGAVTTLSGSLGMSSERLLLFVIVITAVYNTLGGFVTLPAQEFVASVIPMTYRGRYSGLSNTMGSLFGIGSMAVGAWILTHYPRPLSFGILFLITWFFAQSGYAAGLFAKERKIPVEKVPKAWSKEMLGVVRKNKPFLRVLFIYVYFMLLVAPCSVFVSPYALKQLHMSYAIYGALMVSGKVIAVLAFPVAGFLADRLGAKRMLPFLPIFSALGYGTLVVFPNIAGVFVRQAIDLMYYSIFATSLATLIYCLPKPEHRAAHYTFYSICVFTTTSVGPMVFGKLVDLTSYRTMFLAATVLSVVALPIVTRIARSISDDWKKYA